MWRLRAFVLGEFFVPNISIGNVYCSFYAPINSPKLSLSDIWCPIYHTYQVLTRSKWSKKTCLFPTHIRNTRFSLRRHAWHHLQTSQILRRACCRGHIDSQLFYSNSTVTSYKYCIIRPCSDARIIYLVRRPLSPCATKAKTEFETSEFSEGPLIVSSSSSTVSNSCSSPSSSR